MASPQIVNRRPDQGDINVDALVPFRFGVRDLDTRADLTTVYSLVTYGDGLYDPANADLPAVDTVLSGADVTVYFSTFDDASGTTEPGNPCDQTLELVVSTDVYRIEKSDADGVPQEGVLFLTVAAQSLAQPYSFKATIDLVNVNVDTFSYVTFSGFTGVMMGAVYWPESTAVFLFFVDDGTKKLVVAGPSTDGIGTRTVETAVVFDWSAEAYTYSIIVDPSVHRRMVSVYATDSAGAETLIDEVDMGALNPFLTTARIGALFAADSPVDKVTFLLGGDFPDMADYIDVYGFDILDFGRTLLVAGSPTGDSTLDVHPTEVIFLDGPAGAPEWRLNGSPIVTQTQTATKLVSTTGDEYYYRDEPDFSDGEWLVMGSFAGGNASHVGVYSTGMGLVVQDGTRSFNLTLLDDFSRNFLGIKESDATDDAVVSGYKVPSVDTDWEEGFSFILLGSVSRDVLRLYVDSDTTLAIDHTYTAAGYPASTGNAIQAGFFESGALSGDFYLLHLWVLPNCTHYEPVDTTFPESQGWTRVVSGSAVRSITAADELELDCTATGEYDIYYITDATYDAESGAAVVFRLEVTNWTDSADAADPIRTEFGPVVAVRTTTVASQLFFVQEADGTTYVYVAQDTSDVSDVLAQNTNGLALSAEVDLSIAHTYLLDVKPNQYIRLYIDHDTDPVIDIAWTSSSTGLRALPTNMPSAAVVAVGSMGEDTGVRGLFAYFRASIGRGYDLEVSVKVTEAELQDNVYGALADLLIDVQDED